MIVIETTVRVSKTVMGLIGPSRVRIPPPPLTVTKDLQMSRFAPRAAGLGAAGGSGATGRNRRKPPCAGTAHDRKTIARRPPAGRRPRLSLGKRGRGRAGPAGAPADGSARSAHPSGRLNPRVGGLGGHDGPRLRVGGAQLPSTRLAASLSSMLASCSGVRPGFPFEMRVALT